MIVSIKITKELIVVFVASVVLYDATDPRLTCIEVGIWIFPPPDLIVSCVGPEYDVQVTILTPFPGTPLYARLEREGRITAPGRWDRCTLFDLNFRPSGMSPEQLVDGFRKLVVKLYGEEFTRWRRERFRRRLRTLARRKGVASHEGQGSDLDVVRSRSRV